MAGIESKYIWHNGKFIDWHECHEHNVMHWLHYWTSVFEGIRFYNTKDGVKIFRLKDHIERLFFSASVIDIKLEYTVDEIVEICKDLIKRNELDSWYIRPIIYYGYKKMWLDPVGADINFSISAWVWGKYLSEDPIKVWISKYKRLHPETAEMSAKIWGYYFNSVLAHREVAKKGFQEALLLDCNGNIAEGPGENIFFVKWNELYTPSLWNILPWITRDTIIKIAYQELGMKTIETQIQKDEFKLFDEAFFSGTAAEVTNIGSITDTDGAIKQYKQEKSLKIKDIYTKVVTWELEKYNEWLY